MFVRIAVRRTAALVVSATCLVLLSTAASARPSRAPANCSGCHVNPSLTSSPVAGGTLTFADTLVGQTSSADFTINNATTTSTRGGFTGIYSGASGIFTPTASAGITNGTLGGDGKEYLTPGRSDTRSYTFAPTTRGTATAAASFTVTNGFSSPPTVNITLQGQGVAPVIGVDASRNNAGNVRIGTTGSAQITVNNTGDGNQSGQGDVSNLHGTVSAASGPFSGAGGAFNLGDGASQAFVFSFAPTGHGAARSRVEVSTTNGSGDGNNSAQGAQDWGVAGTGVGPTFHASGALTFSEGVTSNVLSISNITSDADLGPLTDLTLLSAQITGADAGMFSLLNFALGTQLGKGDAFDLGVGFTPGSPGTHSAVLRLITDQDAALGANGSEFTFNVVATAVPEPGVFQLLLAGLVGMGALLRQRRKTPLAPTNTARPSGLVD